MEIKNTLQKPYEEKDRIKFIVEQNHRLGYEIRETETELQAWGYTQEEIEQQQKEQRKLEVQNKIKELNEYVVDYIRIGDQKEIDIINNIILGLENSLSD